MSATNGSRARPGCRTPSRRPPGDERAQDRDDDDEHDRRQDEREHEEPDDAASAAADPRRFRPLRPSPYRAVRVAGSHPRRRRGPGLIGRRRGSSRGPLRVAGSSAGADRHLVRSSVLASGVDAVARIASTAPPSPGVELVLEDDRRGFPVDPRAIGVALGRRRRAAGAAALHRPRRCSARWLVSRSSRKVTGIRAERRAACSTQARVTAGLGAFAAARLERQARRRARRCRPPRRAGRERVGVGGRRRARGMVVTAAAPDRRRVRDGQPDPPLAEVDRRSVTAGVTALRDSASGRVADGVGLSVEAGRRAVAGVGPGRRSRR